jgi:hypothetical protein
MGNPASLSIKSSSTFSKLHNNTKRPDIVTEGVIVVLILKAISLTVLHKTFRLLAIKWLQYE